MPDAVLGSVVDGRYKVLSRLGSGGMADVYLAEDEQLGRKVALKLLHRRFAEDPGFVERFRREAQAAAGLQHQNVVNVYDRGEFDGTYYIAMEYVPGRTLKQLIREEAPLDPIRAIGITEQILRASRFAHRHGVIHRDLKPHNVIVDDQDQAKVTDFGIARAGASDMTETGSILGTAQYLSPEQAQGHAVSGSSDLYSIAVVLYEMLTGKVPFDGDQAVTIAIRHVSEAPMPVTQVNPSVPIALEQVVMWALNKNPADRPADADQFIAALEWAKTAITSGEGGQHTAAMAAVGGIAGGDGGLQPPAPAAAPETPPPAQRLLSDDPYLVPPAAGPPEDQKRNGGGGGRRWWLWLMVVLLVLLLAGGGVAAYLLTRPTNHIVPTVDGESVTTAEAAVADAGFTFTVVRQPDQKPAGTVFAQFPLGGTKAKAGSKVTLTVSDGPGNVTVPAVIGEPEAQAEEAIRTARLGVGAISQQNSSSVPSGNVISSAPVAGQSVPAGEKVNLIVSSGAPMKKVPNVVGQSQSAAKSALQSAGFQVTVSTEQTSSAPANNVISQNPSGGTQEPSGFTVSIVVAKALPKKSTVTVPDVKGDTPTQATSTLQAAGFAVTQASRNVTNSSLNGLVVSERPAANSTTKKGATVTITVGKYTATTTSTNTTTTPTSTTSTTGT